MRSAFSTVECAKASSHLDLTIARNATGIIIMPLFCTHTNATVLF